MNFSIEDQAAIAARAATLFERLEVDWTGDDPEAGARTAEIMDAWRQAAAGGDPERFARRLRLAGWEVDGIRRALNPRTLEFEFHRRPHRLPPWTQTVAQILEAVETHAGAGHEGAARFLNREQPVPFEEILIPFVRAAVRKLEVVARLENAQLAKLAHSALERSLLLQLSRISSPTFDLKFSVFRACQQASRPDAWPSFLELSSREQYRLFIQEMLASELRVTFLEYPVLARLAATAVDQWVDSTAEFLRRLAADRAEIQRRFGAGEDPGQVTELTASLSDRHHGGRSVLGVKFSSGLSLVYKPKGLGLEAAYARLQHWLNEQGSPLPFKLLRVLDCSTHGWVEWVEAASCRSEAEASRYYRRAGMLLGLLHAMGTTDCHRDNLIACGEHPMLVDLETLLHHQVRVANGERYAENAVFIGYELMLGSVMRVGLLPWWDVNGRGEADDPSGLGGGWGQAVPYSKWLEINTDRMRFEPVTEVLEPQANTPWLDGKPLLADQFTSEIIAGFESMYQFLMAQRTALLAPEGPLAGFSGQPVRFVFRNTRIYGRLQQRLLNPRFLENGIIRSIELDVLARAFLTVDHHPFWPILRREHEAMERLDIPCYTAQSDSDSLVLGPDDVIERGFEEPSYDQMRSRFRALNPTDLTLQVAFIQGALFAGAAPPNHHRTLPAGRPNAESHSELGTIEPLDPDALVQQAVVIAEELRKHAIRSANGGATWIAPTYLPEADRYQLQPLSCDLYSGSAGVALFFCALAGVTRRGDFRELALGALAPLREFLRDHEGQKWIFRQGGIGGVVGLGSIIYALVRAGQFLGEDLHVDAQAAAALITPERIREDRTLDIMAGSAGAILGLLTLHRCTNDPKALATAIACGHHLLEKRSLSEQDLRVWALPDKRALTGYSHGMAGIAYALLKLYQATAAAEFRAAAQEALGYEEKVFVSAAGNWPDYRPNPSPDNFGANFMTSWCHGAPGIGLARLGSLDILDTPTVRAEIETSLRTTLAHGLQGADHLCCGNLGRTDLLIGASQRLQRPELLQVARQQAAWVSRRAERTGGFRLHMLMPQRLPNPGFFNGNSGIGYQFLRLAYPERVPSVLVSE